MIRYTALDHKQQQLTVSCNSREEALDLVESDLLNGVTPLLLEMYGVRLSLPFIMALVTKRWRQLTSGMSRCSLMDCVPLPR